MLILQPFGLGEGEIVLDRCAGQTHTHNKGSLENKLSSFSFFSLTVKPLIPLIFKWQCGHMCPTLYLWCCIPEPMTSLILTEFQHILQTIDILYHNFSSNIYYWCVSIVCLKSASTPPWVYNKVDRFTDRTLLQSIRKFFRGWLGSINQPTVMA